MPAENQTRYDGDTLRVEQYVRQHKCRRKTLTLEDLQTCLGTLEWERIHAAIAPLLLDGAIEPLKTARSNGIPSCLVHEKYRILINAVPTHDLTTLHPALVRTPYLERNSEACHKWWNDLTALSAWLRKSSDANKASATMRERCWEVFGNEKKYEEHGFTSCVRRASERDLRELLDACDDIPEDLPFVVAPGVIRPQSIVVVENRDPFLAIRSGLLVGKQTLFGQPLDAAVWGRGNVVRQSDGDSLRLALESMHAAEDCYVSYWGDIDREGLSILAALQQAGLVEPLAPAFAAMLDARRNEPRPSPDGRDLPMPCVDAMFDATLAPRVVAIARDGMLLPQEVVDLQAIWQAME